MLLLTAAELGPRGTIDKTAVRPVKFTERDAANQLLRNAKLLRSREGLKSLYICLDRTVSERMAYKKLLEELKLKREAEPDKFYVIPLIRTKKIVSNSENCVSGVPGWSDWIFITFSQFIFKFHMLIIYNLFH